MCEYIFISIISIICLFCILKYWKKLPFAPVKIDKAELIAEKIIRSLPGMIFVFDRSLRILRLYNPNEKELMLPASQLIGKDIREYIDRKFVDMIESCIRETIETDAPCEIEYEIEKSTGTVYYEGRFLSVGKNEFACIVRNITERKKNELQFKQNHDLLNSVLDNIPFPVMMKDVDDDFRYIYWNKECVIQGGFERDEILGKTDVDIYGEERGAQYQMINQKVVEEGKSYRNQEIFITPNGKEHVSIVYKNLISNHFHNWLLVTRWDITDLIDAEKSLKEANRMNRLILDNTNIGFIFLSENYIVQWENISTYSGHPIARGYTKGTLCYRNVLGIDQPCPNCIMKKAIDSGNTEQKTVIFDDGTTTEIIATPVYNENKELLGVVLKVEDITVKRQISLELEKAKEDAEKSDRLKSAFLANMSHEIRTPLNAILGFSELLCQTDDFSEKETYMEIIQSNNDLLLQLVNDILDLSKIEANTLEFIYSDVDINALLKELEQSFRFKIKDHPSLQINFEQSIPHCVVHTEKNRLLQVVSNFITNAIKFTEKGEITFGYKPCDEGLYFYVKDMGAGIPQNKQHEIFDRFIKLDSFKSGTGLGLAICQTIVRKLNGKIGVQSEEGKGATFWFTIPCRLLGDELPEQSASMLGVKIIEVKNEKKEIVSGKKTILIAEDVIDNYKLYQVFLGKKYNLLHAWNGREAVGLFREHEPDAVLMDIKMPEMDGYQATEAIRRINTLVPIIAVTAFAYAEDKKKILEAGFNGYLTKPITSDLLNETLKIIE